MTQARNATLAKTRPGRQKRDEFQRCLDWEHQKALTWNPVRSLSAGDGGRRRTGSTEAFASTTF